jgi:16S rRNA (guanine527-N7)-methyltransferase
MDDRTAALALTPVSRETERRLDAYVDLLVKWQARTNLVAPSTLPHLWTRHVADSLQLLALAPTAQRWLDIGSGGGFPGIVLACALAETPGAHIYLVERIAKKAAFLREALRVTGGAGSVHHGDITDCVDHIPADIDMVTARAVAPLTVLVSLAKPWLNHGSQALFPKGLDVASELQNDTISSSYEMILIPSLTGAGHIVRLARRTSQDPSP